MPITNPRRNPRRHGADDSFAPATAGAPNVAATFRSAAVSTILLLALAAAGCSSPSQDGPTCQNACPSAGAGQCVSGALQLCEETNGDGCLEWGDATPCGLTQLCAAGACEELPLPGAVVINELLFDAVGFDTSAFVELAAEPGLDLTGFVLVGVNGADGLEYRRIDLVGLVDPSGYFVVALPSSDPSILAAADQLDNGADFQNGPDSLQLRWGATVVDAVAYGTFGNGDVAAGEGVPARAGDGLIGRDAIGTDTQENAADFAPLAVVTPGEANLRTLPPVAVLACPPGGPVGAALAFDASASSDADGTVVHYDFDFGDGWSVGGPTPSAAHAYASGGVWTVRVIVTDDLGATDRATCDVSVTGASAPVVTIHSPPGDLEVTQGETLLVEVSATAADGRAVTSVELLVDGAPAGADVSAPYTIAWTVPTEAVTGSRHELVATAIDDQGEVGFSTARRAAVRNDPPTAAFTAVATGATTVSVDASASHDREDEAGLEVCWDWDADGSCDTAWDAARTATHDYFAQGTRTIGLRVRDGVGQVASTTRTVDLANLFYASGEVTTTTTWSGTIVVTGDVHVAAGQTLTIAAGTTVQVVELDQNSDGVGDFGIAVDGTLRIAGTAEAPVVFTSVPAGGVGGARDWVGISLRSGASNSTIVHAVIERADVAVTAQAPVSLTEVELRASRIGLQLQGYAGAATLSSVTLADNAADGLLASAGFAATGLVASGNGGRGLAVTGGTSTVVGCSVTGNATHGVEIANASLGLDGCTIDGNGRVGVLYHGAAGGLLTHSFVTRNGEEGIRALRDATGNPSPVIEWNDVWGNASLGGVVVEPVAFFVTSPSSSTGTFTSAVWSPPSGATIVAVQASYAESDSSSDWVGGYLETGTGVVLETFRTSRPLRWYDVSESRPPSLRTRAVDNASSYYGTAAVSAVAYVDPAARRQVTVVADAGIGTARHDYLGAWPDVASALTYSDAARIDVQGFAGAPFDGTWDAGPYRGGETLTGPMTWGSDVFVTGNVVIGAGGSLTVPAGVRVTFVPTDLDGDATGDWRIERGAGDLSVLGTSGSPVVVTALAPVPAGGGFQGIFGTGAGTTTLQDARIELGLDGLVASGGSHALTDVVVRDCARHGLSVTAGGVTWERGGVSVCGVDGIHVASTIGSTLDHLALAGNAGWGVHLENVLGASRAVLRNSVLSDNGTGGARLLNAAADVVSNTVSGNGQGIRIEGTSTASVTLNDVTGNRQEGVFAIFRGTASPLVAASANNLWGNATEEAAKLEPAAFSVTSPSSSTGTFTSAVWSPPSGSTIVAVQASYAESDSSSDWVGGYLETGTGVVLETFRTNAPLRWYDVAASSPPSLRTRVVDNVGSYYGTAAVSAVVTMEQATSPIRPVELTAILNSGVIDATGNYWGTFSDVAPRIFEANPGTVDYSGFVGAPMPGTGPQ